METDSIKAAVEAKCSNRTDMMGGFACAWIADNTLRTECPQCQGTGFKHPSLSRECGDKVSGYANCLTFSLGHEHGRIPDVTLEKVVELLLVEDEVAGHKVSFAKRVYGYACWVPLDLVGKGNTPLEAACVALMKC